MLRQLNVKIDGVAHRPLGPSTARRPVRSSQLVRAGELPPDWQDKAQGARDPYVGELGTSFAARPLGNADTYHLIMPPHGMDKITGLRSRRCKPCEAGKTQALEEGIANGMRNQVPGWKLMKNAAGHLCLRQEWKLSNFVCSLEMLRRVGALSEDEGHHPDLHLQGWNNVSLELSTHSVGGLTENDFILASKINDLEISDLRPKPKAKLRNFV